jgi:hypothetical protein
MRVKEKSSNLLITYYRNKTRKEPAVKRQKEKKVRNYLEVR